MSSFLDETKKASEIAKQTQMNKSAKIAFAGHFTNFITSMNFKKQIEDMRRFYPREYIDGAMSQIQIR